MATTTDTKIIDYNLECMVHGYCYPRLVRKLTLDDFTVGEWKMPGTFESAGAVGSTEPTAYATLTLKQDVYDAIMNEDVKKVHGADRNSPLVIDPWCKKAGDTTIKVSAYVKRTLTYVGLKKNKQSEKYTHACAELAEAVTKQEGRDALQKEVDKVNRQLQRWVEGQRQNYIITGTSAVVGYSNDKMKEEAGVLPLDEQIEILQAQIDGLRKVRHEKWVAYVRKEWEKDTTYPEELRAAVIQAIDEGKMNSCPRLFLH